MSSFNLFFFVGFSWWYVRFWLWFWIQVVIDWLFDLFWCFGLLYWCIFGSCRYWNFFIWWCNRFWFEIWWFLENVLFWVCLFGIGIRLRCSFKVLFGWELSLMVLGLIFRVFTLVFGYFFHLSFIAYVFIVVVLDWVVVFIENVIGCHFERLFFVIVEENDVIFIVIEFLVMFSFQEFDLPLFLLFIQVVLMRYKSAMQFMLERIVQFIIKFLVSLTLSRLSDSFLSLVDHMLSAICLRFTKTSDWVILRKGVFSKLFIRNVWTDWGLRY